LKPLLPSALGVRGVPLLLTRFISTSGVRRGGGGHGPAEPAQLITVTFVDASNRRTTVTDAKVGETLMDVAWRHDVDIPGYCGGDNREEKYGLGPQCEFCACYIANEFLAKTPPPEDVEVTKAQWNKEVDINPNFRMACQVFLTEEMDGVVVGLPEYHWTGFGGSRTSVAEWA